MEGEPPGSEIYSNRKWLFYFSPCIIAGLFSLFIIIYGHASGGWNLLGPIIFTPVFFALIGFDVAIKLVLNKLALQRKVLYIWLIECTFVILIGFYLRYYYGLFG